MGFTLVTGSASGIGAATLHMLKASGRGVLGADISHADICVDLSTREGCQQLLEQVDRHCDGSLDGLVLCAGLGPLVKPAAKIVAVNYFCTINCMDALFPMLCKGQNPAAVVVSSIASLQLPWHRNPLASALETLNEAEVEALLAARGEKASLLAYSASKNALTVAIRKRSVVWGEAGVRLNAIAPGSVSTPMQQATLHHPTLANAIRIDEVPLGRVAQADEIAPLISFLLSDRATYVHGAQWVVDGGKDAVKRRTAF